MERGDFTGGRSVPGELFLVGSRFFAVEAYAVDLKEICCFFCVKIYMTYRCRV